MDLMQSVSICNTCKKMLCKYFWLLMMLMLTVALTACGGGGGTATSTVSSAPTNVSAVGVDSSVTVAWIAVSGATSYNVKRSTVSGGPYSTVGSSTTTSYVNTDCSIGTTYYYVVSAVTSSGESTNSSQVAVTPTAGLAALADEDSSKNYVGLNTWFLNDWDGGFAFVDAMKHARQWKDSTGSTALSGSAIDAYGWPNQDASTVIIAGSYNPTLVNGSYKLVFTGQATVSTLYTLSVSISNQIYNSSTNTTTADATVSGATSGAVLGLVFKNSKKTASSATNSGVANVRLYRPGYASDGSALFTTPFLNAMAKSSVVRMMDWTLANSNTTQSWSDRRTPLHFYKAGPTYSYSDGSTLSGNTGMALEDQIQLCNTLNSDCWINIPMLADDDYVRKIALALRYGTDGTNPYSSTQASPVYPPLKSSLRVYIEYANEIWNSAAGFNSYHVLYDMVKNKLASTHPLKTVGTTYIGTSDYYKTWAYPAWRMTAISDIFRSVYGDASMMNRIRPLLMTQAGDGQLTLSRALLWLDAYGKTLSPARSVNSYLYGAGGSAYYGVTSWPAYNDSSLAALFFASGNYPEANAYKRFGVDATWAMNYGLKRIAYEGGMGLDHTGYTDTTYDLLNLDSRMQSVMEQSHEAWSQAGGDLLVYYVVTGGKAWEMTNDISDLTTPKMKALTNIKAGSRAAVTLGQALPGTIVLYDWTSYVLQYGGGSSYTCNGSSTSNCYAGFSEPKSVGTETVYEWLSTPAHSNSAFSGSITVNGAADKAATINVWVNGVYKGQVTMAVSSRSATVNSSTLSGINIPKGLVVIRLEVASGGDLAVYSITVS